MLLLFHQTEGDNYSSFNIFLEKNCPQQRTALLFFFIDSPPAWLCQEASWFLSSTLSFAT